MGFFQFDGGASVPIVCERFLKQNLSWLRSSKGWPPGPLRTTGCVASLKNCSSDIRPSACRQA